MATHSPLSLPGNQEADALIKIQTICLQLSLAAAHWVHVRFGHLGANTGWKRAKAAIGPKKCALCCRHGRCHDGANAEIDLSVCADLTDRLLRVYSSWAFFPSYF